MFKGIRRNIQRYRYKTTNKKGNPNQYRFPLFKKELSNEKLKLELEKDLRYYIGKYNLLNRKCLLKLKILYGKEHTIFQNVKFEKLNNTKNQFLNTLNIFNSENLLNYMKNSYNDQINSLKKNIKDYYDIAIYDMLVNNITTFSKLKENIDKLEPENLKIKNKILLKLRKYLEKMKKYVNGIDKTIKTYNNNSDDKIDTEISKKLYNTIYIYTFVIQMYNHCHDGTYILDEINSKDNELFKYINNKFKENRTYKDIFRIKDSKCYDFNDLTNDLTDDLISNSDKDLNRSINSIYFEQWNDHRDLIYLIINPIELDDTKSSSDTVSNPVSDDTAQSSPAETVIPQQATVSSHFPTGQSNTVPNIKLPNLGASMPTIASKYTPTAVPDTTPHGLKGGKKKQKKQKKPEKDKSKKTKKEKSKKDKKK